MFRRPRPRAVPLSDYAAGSDRTDLRLASVERDYWQLRDAVRSEAEHPDTFVIPPASLRENLRRMDLVQLIFDIEGDEDGQVELRGERMWALVAERVGRNYIGILRNKPALIDPASRFYLRMGCEVLFAPEHVSDLYREEPSRRALRAVQGEPTLRWPYRV